MPKHELRRSLRLECLEDRHLLATGPYLFVHNANQLAVVDAGEGDLEVIQRLTGFQGTDRAMNDIAFSPTSRLYGIADEWLYEIHPVTGRLTPLGIHGIEDATSLVFNPAGALQAMGQSSPDLFQMTITDTTLVSVSKLATLSGLDSTEGSNGDIAYYLGDLIVATTDNRLISYRFDINPDRPRIIQEVDLSDAGMTNVFGLAVVDNNRLYATAGTSVFEMDLSDPNAPTAIEVPVDDTQFGSMRGAAYYSEAGGPVPVGTISGVKWFDRNRDGRRQLNEPTLTDWPIYIDQNLNGSFDLGEPLRTTDEDGRYFFFGREPGLYTVDEIILDTDLWEQTYPVTPHRNVVGLYNFENGRTNNQLLHGFGLPDLINSLVSVGAGSAEFIRNASYLELPWALGDTPFTIVIDASYPTVFGGEQFLVSQDGGADGTDRVFQSVANADTLEVSTSVCDTQGDCRGPDLGTVDGTPHRYAITWDGQSVGAFFDGRLVVQATGGSLPDVEGGAVRFGNPANTPSPAGLRGTVFQIQIYNTALPEADLRFAFENPFRPNAYSLWLDDEVGLDAVNFGNAEPTVKLPEIVVARDDQDGPEIINGDLIDLGIAASTDELLRSTIWMTNVGDAPLEISSVTVSAGFQIDGNPVDVLEIGESTSLDVVLVDTTQGTKAGEILISSNDADENPFVIQVTAEILDPDTRPRQILINSSSGSIFQIDPLVGVPQSLLSGGPSLTDIAYNPRDNRLYGVDATFLYEVDLAAREVTMLFAHNVRFAQALGFSPSGQLFAAGEDVYRLDIENRVSQKYADGGTALAGDIAFLGNRLLMSTEDGNLYDVQPNLDGLLGNLAGIGMNGLVATDTNTLYGFSDNRGYLIDVDNMTVTPQFGLLVFTIAGATFQPFATAHNEDNPLDVDGDDFVVPLDALLVINELNSPTFTDPVTGRLIGAPIGETRYPDVDDDGFVTPIDALLIINELNAKSAAGAIAATDTVMGIGEGEGQSPGEPETWLGDLSAQIASALASQSDHQASRRR